MAHYIAHYDALDDIWVVDGEGGRLGVVVGSEGEARVCAWALNHVADGDNLESVHHTTRVSYHGPSLDIAWDQVGAQH